MSTHKHIDKICCAVIVLSLLLALLFANGEALGLTAVTRTMGYESRLFNAATVHTIDIRMDDWESFIETCADEEYAQCSVVIDGELYKGVGIRAKGNTSLSSVSQMNSDRYSFKLEFDQYDSTKSYYGLDKLSLNNLIQDNTYMKDFLTYQMMNAFGVSAPLCSYAYITVNGEDWGLYLAVEGVEDAFLERNYGVNHGELYKPDSLSFGGGRGNGRDFNMDDFDFGNSDSKSEDSSAQWPGGFDPSMDGMGGGGFPAFSLDEDALRQALEERGINPSILDGVDLENPDFASIQKLLDGLGDVDWASLMGSVMGRKGMDNMADRFNGGGFGGFGGMGSSDVKLQYIDDDPASYSNIFDNAKTEVTDADKTRLIESLKTLSSGENIESVVDIDAALRYFVVHNFVVNGDSYTGSMVHNYYLYEENGRMSMIPWDYNLAFGTFQGSNASSSVNDPIDSPVSGGSAEDRPMVSWILGSEEYTNLYHAYFAEFIETFFSSGDFTEFIDSTSALIHPYVEQDPTKFCTLEEFEAGVEAIRKFCLLRAQSVSGQLDGSIPSTSEGQSADSSALIDTGNLSISAMGTMGNTMGGGRGNREGFGQQSAANNDATDVPEQGAQGFGQMPGGDEVPPAGAMPSIPQQDAQGSRQMPGSGAPPNGETPSMPQQGAQGFGQMPGGGAPPNGETPSMPQQGTQGWGSMPNGNFSSMSDRQAGINGSAGFSPWVWIGASTLVLLAGLIVALKYRR